MTKQEIIKQEWGNAWYLITGNAQKQAIEHDGWVFVTSMPTSYDKSIFDFQHNNAICRPKSLQGIENNNGWIKIESEDDLPKGSDIYYRCGKMFDNGEFVIDELFIYNYIDKNKYTHYQPIEKPKFPFY